MKRLYGLKNDKENISLIIDDDKAMLIIQTAGSFEVRELNVEFDLENENEISADKVKTMGFSSNYDGGNESEVYVENGMIGAKTEPMNLKVIQAINEMSKKITDLDNKINLKVDAQEFWGFLKYYKDTIQQKD